MKVVCDTCGRTARGNIDELIDLGWSRVMVSASFHPASFHKTFTACWRHGGELLVDLVDAFADVPEEHRLVRLLNNEVK